MHSVEKLFILNNEVKLEAEVFQTEKETPSCVALMCHPHPQFFRVWIPRKGKYGGDMYNNVVSSVFNSFVKKDISCMRFNFRGAGNSTGNHTSGKGELSDVKSCIDHLTESLYFDRVFICGYSYGAAIGCSAINYSEKIIGYCAISFPWDFMSVKYKEFSQSIRPKLFIQGDMDTVAPYENFMIHFNYYSEPKKFTIIEGADHFYQGFESAISREVINFYESIIT